MEEYAHLLCEIGVEELPHSISFRVARDFKESFTKLLDENRIDHGEVRLFSTPRRFSILIQNVSQYQSDYEEEKRGPSFDKAYSDGRPTRALLGFCRANGIEPEEVVFKEVRGSRYIFAVKKIKGDKTVKLLPDILETVLNGMRFPKTMRWEKSNFSFIRPIRWILFKYGDEVVGYDKVGLSSSEYTFGHRVYSSEAIKVENVEDYEELLNKACVVADRDKRLNLIREGVERITKELNTRVPEGAEVLFEVNTDLTELPNPVLCSFEEEYLTLPPEVLISEMVEHQRYFPLMDSEGKITNNFIVISNIKDNTKSKAGFERVLRARLNDGKFFYEEDKKRNFFDYLEDLKAVSFHPELGSMEEKVRRVEKISGVISDYLKLEDEVKRDILEAATLCKNDLVTQMVGEFPNLQGIMGYYYALESGHGERVAKAIKDHYRPRFSGDRTPEDIVGSVVGIADRLDSIIGIFSTGYEPKGSRDPYGLRRAVFSIIRIIVDKKINLSLSNLLSEVVGIYPLVKDRENFKKKLEDFFKTRIRSVFQEIGFDYDEIDAAMANVLDDIYEAYRRVEALHRFRSREGFKDLFIAFKRMANIVKEGGECDESGRVNPDLFVQQEEKALYNYYLEKKSYIKRAIDSKDYEEVYEILGSFKSYVDDFFDNVLVMEDNRNLRCNRIYLLREIVESFSGIIDFSKLVVS